MRSVGATGEATYYDWREKYGGLMPSEMKGLRQIEEKERQG
jgi:putative transposase